MKFWILFALGLAPFGYGQAQVQIRLSQPEVLLEQVSGFDIGISPALAKKERTFIPQIQQQLQSKQYQKLLTELESQLTPQQASAAMNYLLGQLALQLKLYAKAESYFAEAVARQGHYAKAIVGLGMVSLQQEKFAEASGYFAKALRLGVNDPQLYHYLGHSYLQQQAYASAVIALERAKLLAPNDSQLDQALIYSYSHSGQQEAALALIEQRLLEQPELAELWLLRANSYLQQENFPLALSSLESALRLGEKQTNNLALTAQLQLQHGSAQRATELYQSLWSHVASEPLVLDAMNYLLDSNRITQAEKLLGLISRNPPQGMQQQSEVHYLQARLLLAQHQVQPAFKALQQALKLNPIHGPALLQLAQLYRQEGESHKAEMALLRAREIELVKLQALTELADLKLSIGQLNQALALLRQALEIAPNQQSLINNVQTLQQMIIQSGKS